MPHQRQPATRCERWDNLSEDRYTFAGKDPLPAGKAEIKVDFDYHGKPGEPKGQPSLSRIWPCVNFTKGELE